MKYIVSAESLELDGYKLVKAHPTLTTYGNTDRDIDDASATQIVARGLIEYAKSEDVARIVGHLATKLRHGGELHLHYTSAIAAANFIRDKSYDLTELNKTVFGTGPYKRNLVTASFIEGLLLEAGLQVVKRRIEGISGIIVAKRN
jgi:hypothetical protein